MSMDRREFVKSVSAIAGTAALAGLATSAAEADDKAAAKKGAGGPYEVFALKYAGPFTRPVAMTFFNTGYKDDIQIYYYIWAIRAKNGETTLVDTGLGKNLGKKFQNFVPANDVAARLGIKPEQVTRVVITHMHFDHVSGMEDFPKAYPHAKFYIQKKEFDFWVNDPRGVAACLQAVSLRAGDQGGCRPGQHQAPGHRQRR